MGFKEWWKWMGESPYHRQMMARAEADNSRARLDSIESLLEFGATMKAGHQRSSARKLKNFYDRAHDQNDEIQRLAHRLVISGAALAAIHEVERRMNAVERQHMPLASMAAPLVAGAVAGGPVGFPGGYPRRCAGREKFRRAVNAIYEDDEVREAARYVYGIYSILDNGSGVAHATRCWCEPDESADGIPQHFWQDMEGHEPGFRKS
jgi:hypothetical protein